MFSFYPSRSELSDWQSCRVRERRPRKGSHLPHFNPSPPVTARTETARPSLLWSVTVLTPFKRRKRDLITLLLRRMLRLSLDVRFGNSREKHDQNWSVRPIGVGGRYAMCENSDDCRTTK